MGVELDGGIAHVLNQTHVVEIFFDGFKDRGARIGGDALVGTTQETIERHLDITGNDIPHRDLNERLGVWDRIGARSQHLCRDGFALQHVFPDQPTHHGPEGVGEGMRILFVIAGFIIIARKNTGRTFDAPACRQSDDVVVQRTCLTGTGELVASRTLKCKK